MFQHLIVPVDGSPASLRSLAVAASMAARVGGTVQAVTVVDRRNAAEQARSELARGIEQLGPLPVQPTQCVLFNPDDSVASIVARLVDSTAGAAPVMSSHGHARSAAVLGSTTDEVLHHLFGPVIVIGPRCRVEGSGALDGVYVVPLDGSDRADSVLPIVAAWTIEFAGSPWLVEVVDEARPSGSDVVESAYVSHRAAELRKRIGRGVEHEVLHGDHPAHAIVDFASTEHASLIFLTTHGRTGLTRLRSGSVAAEVVRRAPCPVVLFRPPELRGTAIAGRRDDRVGEHQGVVPPEWSREWCEQYRAVDLTLPVGPRRALARFRR
jgi:nucleotide-binding universal stress UspA family protein